MTSKDFINQFVLEFPRLYVRLISYNLPFTEELLVKYGYLLSWDKYGILGNSRIKWTDNLKARFSERLQGKYFGPSEQHYLGPNSNELDTEIADIVFYEVDKHVGRKYHRIKFSELSLDLLRKYKNEIKDWRTIAWHFDKIDYDFIIEFKDKIDLSLILLNSSIEWSDTRLFSFYLDIYDIVICKSVWINFIKKFTSINSIKDHFEAFNELDKVVKINWKSEDRNKDNTLKYLLSIYVKSKYGNQIMTSGYYRTEKDFPLGKTIEIGKDYKFPISNDYFFRSRKQKLN